MLTSSAGIRVISAAGVPGLGKNWLMKRDGNLYFEQRSRVSVKSFSVSVGNPQIISVAIVIPGTLKTYIFINYKFNNYSPCAHTLISMFKLCIKYNINKFYFLYSFLEHTHHILLYMRWNIYCYMYEVAQHEGT